MCFRVLLGAFRLGWVPQLNTLFYLTEQTFISVYNFSDNLKTLFRPISMMLPDLQHIAEIELLSYGYENAKSLGTKIVTMFQLFREQLIAQPHYDFGMRALKIVLEMCERAKVQFTSSKNEEHIAVEIIRQTIFCMLDDEDVNIFEVYSKLLLYVNHLLRLHNR